VARSDPGLYASKELRLDLGLNVSFGARIGPGSDLGLNASFEARIGPGVARSDLGLNAYFGGRIRPGVARSDLGLKASKELKSDLDMSKHCRGDVSLAFVGRL